MSIRMYINTKLLAMRAEVSEGISDYFPIDEQ